MASNHEQEDYQKTLIEDDVAEIVSGLKEKLAQKRTLREQRGC